MNKLELANKILEGLLIIDLKDKTSFHLLMEISDEVLIHSKFFTPTDLFSIGKRIGHFYAISAVS